MRILLALLIVVSQPALAGYMDLEPKRNPNEPRNAVWRPLASLVLPGFGQYFDGQIAEGLSYSAVAGGGYLIAAAAAEQIDKKDRNATSLEDSSDAERQYMYGSQLAMFAGEMSTYHAFRTAVLTRQPIGDYTFIKANKETTLDVMWSPFELEHITSMKTWLPLLILAGVGAATINNDAYLDFGDTIFTLGTSYNAGVGEEALFRGYFMPVLRQNLGDSYWWANAIQAVVFGAAHYGESNRFPLAQTLMGFYLGWMNHANGYSIREAAFLHTWWDVLAIGFLIAHENGKKAEATRVPLFQFMF